MAGICVMSDGPYVYSEAFRQAVRTGAPGNADLHSMLDATLEQTEESDLAIFTMSELLLKETKSLPTDRQLLDHLERGCVQLAMNDLRRRLALAHADQLLKLGEAYGPRARQAA